MTTHTMHVDQSYLNMIAAGTKDIECRLYDTKRRQISIGDTIVFYDDDIRVTSRVVGLVITTDFAKLFNLVGTERTGLADVADPVLLMQKFYTPTAQSEHGVVGIVLE